MNEQVIYIVVTVLAGVFYIINSFVKMPEVISLLENLFSSYRSVNRVPSQLTVFRIFRWSIVIAGPIFVLIFLYDQTLCCRDDFIFLQYHVGNTDYWENSWAGAWQYSTKPTENEDQIWVVDTERAKESGKDDTIAGGNINIPENRAVNGPHFFTYTYEERKKGIRYPHKLPIHCAGPNAGGNMVVLRLRWNEVKPSSDRYYREQESWTASVLGIGGEGPKKKINLFNMNDYGFIFFQMKGKPKKGDLFLRLEDNFSAKIPEGKEAYYSASPRKTHNVNVHDYIVDIRHDWATVRIPLDDLQPVRTETEIDTANIKQISFTSSEGSGYVELANIRLLRKEPWYRGFVFRLKGMKKTQEISATGLCFGDYP